MRFLVLGPVTVDPASSVGELTGRQRALVARLALAAPRPVSADQLVEAVWPSQPPHHPANALQGRVSKLRRLLGTGGGALVSRAEGYALEVDGDQIDARCFEELADDAHRLLGAGEFDAAAGRAEAALGLWRGAAFEGLADEPWAQPEAIRLEERRLATLEDRIAADLGRGEHARLVPELERLVATSPLRERTREQLMVALYRSGRQADALEVFRAGRDLLADELGLDPGPGLAQLERAILAHDPGLDLPYGTDASITLVATPPPTAPPQKERHGGAHPLAGRDRELATLHDALRRAQEHAGTAVLIGGGAGIGKSELVTAFARDARDAGVDVRIGRCAETAGAPPLWPWVQVLRSLVADLDPPALAGAAGTGAPELAQLVPEVRQRLPEVAPRPGGDPDQERFRLHDAVAGFLQRVAARRPLVVVLEDIQHAGASSLELLALVATAITDLGLLLVATFRPADAGPATPAGSTLGRLGARAGVERLTLTGLARPDLAMLVRQRRGASPAPALVDALAARTGGNPLFAVELLRLLDQRSSDDDVGDEAERILTALPQAVRDVVIARLAGLAEPTRAVVDAAAVAGREFDLDVVARMLGRPLAEVADALDEAARAGIVEEADDHGFGSLRFVHVLVRDTVVAELAPLRRARLHAAAADALDHDAGEQHDAAVAHHLAEAVPLVPAGRAVDAAVAAADHATRVFAFDVAAHHLDDALELLARHGPDRAREITVQSRRVGLHTRTGAFTAPQVRAAADRVKALAGHLTEAPEVAGTLWSQWAYWANRARIALAEELAHDLLTQATGDPAAATADPAAAAAGHFAVGQTAFLTGAPQRAARHLDEARRLGADVAADEWRRRGLELLAVNLDCAAAHPLWLAGRGGEADRLARHAVDAADLAGHDYARAHVRMFFAWYLAVRGDGEQALVWAADARRRCDAGGYPMIGALAQAFEGWATAATGDPATGIGLLWAGMERLREIEFAMLRPLHLTLSGQALLAAGRAEEALAALDEAVATAERTGALFHLAVSHRWRGEVLRARGEPAAADAFDEAARVADDQGSPTLREHVERARHG